MIDHREGCAVVRTGNCTCAYLAQWDKQDIPEPPVTEGCTRIYPEGGGFLDVPSALLRPIGSRNKEDS